MTPLELFVGRREEIAAFGDLLAPTSPRWVMLVSGLSGTGKSLLIEWLRQNCCKDVRSAKIQLTPNTTAPDFLRLLALQLDPEYAAALGEKLGGLEQIERQRPLVHVSAPSMTMEGKLGGRISEATQTSNTVVNLGSFAEVEALERETARLDALIGVIQPLGAARWVLFVDEAEHLEGSIFGRFLLERLVPRLRARFPGFRLYISGQSLPAGAGFDLHESIRIELGELNPDEAKLLLKKVDVTDGALQAKVMELTSCHPLLLGMILEDANFDQGAFDPRQGRNLPDHLDQGAVVAWIYRRILGRLPETVRPIAADLALFDWFDLSILRASFGIELKEAPFRDLVQRSFVKAITPGQWRCHDIVRFRLAAERREADPDSVAALCNKAFEAYRGQMKARGEREGAAFFNGRLDYVRGALTSASGFSAAKALAFVTEEFLTAGPSQSNDYLFGLTQMMNSEAMPPAVRALGQDGRRFLDRFNAGRADTSVVAFAERLGIAAADLGNDEARDVFRNVALFLARQCGDWPSALRLAGEIAAARSTIDDKLLLGWTHAEAGSVDEARRMFEAIRAELGDTVEVLTAFGMFNQLVGDSDQAKRYLADAIAAAPEGAEQARLQLARILFQANQDQEALNQVDRLLKIAPRNEDAQRLRIEILAWLGDFRSVSVGGQAAAIYRESEDQMAALFADDKRGAILGAIAENSAAVPVPLLLTYGELVAARGQEDALSRIHAAILEHAPEAKDLVDLQRLTLLIATGRPQLAVDDAENVLSRRPDLPGAYFVLSRIYAMLGRAADSRQVMERLAREFPSLRDRTDVTIASSYWTEGNVKAARKYLEAKRAEQGGIGSELIVLLSMILANAGERNQARDMLERVVFTAGRDELSVSAMITARRLFGILSATTKKTEQARAAAVSLCEVFPRVPAATAAAIDIYWALDDDEAVRSLAAAVGDDAPPALRNTMLGVLSRLELKRYQSSPEALLGAVKAEPQRLELVTAVLALASQIESAEKSAELLGKLYELAPKALAEVTRLSTEFIVADPAMRQTAIAALNARGTPPLTRIGSALVLAGRGYIPAADARESLHDIGKEFPDMALAAQIAEINLLLELNDFEEAGRMLTPFMKPGALVEQAVLPAKRYLMHQDDWQGAVSLLEEAAKDFQKDRRFLLEERADILVEHDAARALAAVEELAAEAPLAIGLTLSRANALGKLARHDEAIAILDEALKDGKIEADERAAALRCRGKWQVEADRGEDAVASYRQAIDLEPKRAAGLVGLSKALAKTGHWSTAYSALRDAVALEPERLSTVEQELQRLRNLAATEKAAA